MPDVLSNQEDLQENLKDWIEEQEADAEDPDAEDAIINETTGVSTDQYTKDWASITTNKAYADYIKAEAAKLAGPLYDAWNELANASYETALGGNKTIAGAVT